ncbi:hypothetical protein TNCV_2182131 [Trichonephila clavipes]|uniref:Uncharacterized protein n=1 Tax=Trichonephila clavipes TaxID=2585209 RepID=A0A8X7B9M8_TRICX|nr:hypothetical protein TNCV_2182131 [Trichonephila clavipes]
MILCPSFWDVPDPYRSKLFDSTESGHMNEKNTDIAMVSIGSVLPITELFCEFTSMAPELMVVWSTDDFPAAV